MNASAGSAHAIVRRDSLANSGVTRPPRGAATPASRRLRRWGVPMEGEVSQVHEEARALTQREHGILPVPRVGEERAAASEAQIPEELRNHRALGILRGDPLHQKSRAEEDLPGHS